MNRILVIGEDALCCSPGEKVVSRSLEGWEPARACERSPSLGRAPGRLANLRGTRQ